MNSGSRGPSPAKRTALIVSDRKSTRLNSSHDQISYAVFCLKKKKNAMLRSVKKGYAMPQRVRIQYSAIVSAAMLSQRYISPRLRLETLMQLDTQPASGLEVE